MTNNIETPLLAEKPGPKTFRNKASFKKLFLFFEKKPNSKLLFTNYFLLGFLNMRGV